jgi:DNA-binding HxlR family transcriptional regulator
MTGRIKKQAGPAGGFDGLPPTVLSTVAKIGGKWKIPVIWLLWLRPRRFGELRKALPGVTQHMLTATLRELERDNLVTRTVHAEVPPRVDYALTDASMGLCGIFEAMQAWGEKYPVQKTPAED